RTHAAVTTGSAEITGIPCAMVLTLMACSPRGTGSLAPVALRIITEQLSASVAAPGPHVFAVRSERARLARRPRPSHPAPRLVTIGHNAPLAETGWRQDAMDFGNGEVEYFCVAIWTLIPGLNRLANFDFARRLFFTWKARRNAPASLTPTESPVGGQ
ncbi:hypothetical protein, partial [Bradyrhizobium sp.]|uniref:hypothetical protein n=1 Tax=Bradyrhizobium sp. TaxID=376 RepID=UPI0025C6FBAF